MKNNNILEKITKESLMVGLKVILGFFFIFILLFVVNNNIKRGEIDYNNLYAEVEEILNQEPFKTNDYIDDILFYNPKGYKFNEGSYIMTRGDMYIEIIPEQIEVENNRYKINQDKELVYEKISNEDDGTDMLVWTENSRYDILLIEKGQYAVAGNFEKNDIYKGIIDMANILNSLKFKEVK